MNKLLGKALLIGQNIIFSLAASIVLQIIFLASLVIEAKYRIVLTIYSDNTNLFLKVKHGWPPVVDVIKKFSEEI